MIKLFNFGALLSREHRSWWPNRWTDQSHTQEWAHAIHNNVVGGSFLSKWTASPKKSLFESFFVSPLIFSLSLHRYGLCAATSYMWFAKFVKKIKVWLGDFSKMKFQIQPKAAVVRLALQVCLCCKQEHVNSCSSPSVMTAKVLNVLHNCIFCNAMHKLIWIFIK